LTEITESDAPDIVKLRNDPGSNKFLFQKELTVEEQLNWIKINKDRTDNKNFKVTNNAHEFKGTISIYNIDNKRGEFGRYIVTNPVNAIEAEYLLLVICFDQLGLNSVYCQTNTENQTVWRQHSKLGFRDKSTMDVFVGSNSNVLVKAVVQEITADEFKAFNYEKVLSLIKKF